MTRILVTGAAGFVGAHYCRRLIDEGHDVVGLDNLNDYYDVALKRDRLRELVGEHDNFRFHEVDLADRTALEALFAGPAFHTVVNLAAQAGVRYSLENPSAYIQSNLVGFGNLLECCRHHDVKHLIFASSSSVYGANTAIPFAEDQGVSHPVSLYAATKKSNEMLAHSYAHLYGLPTTGLRFFTVYGPWGRPDMAYFSFTQAISRGEAINVFNNGDLARDFTYIDDIVEGMVRLLDHIAEPDPAWDSAAPNPATSSAPYRLYNIGNNSPVRLMDFIETLERELGRNAEKHFLPMQPGDVHTTYANVDALADAVGFSPDTPLAEGLARFVAWYTSYYGGAQAAPASRQNF